MRYLSYDYGGVFFYRKKGPIFNIIFFIFNFMLNIIYKLKILNFLLNRIGSSNIFVTKKN